MFAKLLVERALRAFLAAALGTLAVGVQNTTLTGPGVKALAVGAIAAGVSACISLVSQFVGDPNSTSFTSTKVSK